MSALGYLMYIGEIRGLKNRRDRAYEALERVRLVDRADSRIRTLSKGMRQRVGLGMALLHDPEVLILDEPTIGLDPFQVLELRELVKELGRDHTVLFSTHILSEAEQVCDNVVIINNGRIMAQGSPVELRGQIESGRPVIVRVDAPLEDALAIIRAIPAVGRADASLDGITATPANPDIDPRPAIARAVTERGWNLTELRSVAVTLEEIFLEVAGSNHETEAIEEPAQVEAAVETENEVAHE
jgi:ABC-2 type transport system ATP-binding protein